MKLSPTLKRFCAIGLGSAALAVAATVLAANSAQSPPLVIQAQGSFAAGGKVATAPGTFDPRKPMESAGQSYTATMRTPSIRFPQTPGSIRS